MATEAVNVHSSCFVVANDGAVFTNHGALFVAEDIFGFAIIDTGATRSMTSVKQMDWLQNYMYSVHGSDVLATKEANMKFYFAGGGDGASCINMVGVPHDWGLKGDEGYIWFAMMPTDSPTLLGLDWIEAAGFMLDSKEGILRHGTREHLTVPLRRLTTGHWGLPLAV